jgi:hypothetical protein
MTLAPLHLPRVARWGWLFAALVVLNPAVSSARSHDDGSRRHESWSWSGKLASGGRLELNGVNGEIVAEPGSGDLVEVTADKSGRRHDPSEVKIQVVQDSDGITICAVYPGQGNACEPGHSHSETRNNDVRVDFHVKVPAGATFAANTVNGGIHAHSLAGPVHAHTVNGECEIETTQSGDAATVNGSVRAVLGKVSADERLKFATVNGSITLMLPPGLDADVEGSTVNGGIDSDFPVTISGRFGPRNLHGTIGRGGARLAASTVNGSIHLTRSN